MFDGFFNIFHTLEKNGIKDPLKEALKVLDIISEGSVSNIAETFTTKTGITIQNFMERRCSGMPLEYALGYATFMNMCFCCSPHALIPRKETELLAETAINLARHFKKTEEPVLVVDMGTGSGNLAVSIAAHTDNTHVLACDISPEAVELAKINAESYKIQSRVSFFIGDFFDSLVDKHYRGIVDMVVCNPPYIPTGSLAKLAREIIEYEPVTALDAGVYGIDIFRKIIMQSPDFLRSDGVLVFEIGTGQDKFATRLIQKSGKYKNIQYYRDKSGIIRVISAIKS